MQLGQKKSVTSEEFKMHHLLEKPETDRLVRIHLIDENVPGLLISENAYFSRVSFNYMGHYHEIDVLNDDYIITEQIGYEND
jgi:hypothetical protein